MRSCLHLGQKSGKFRSTVFFSSRSRVFAPQMGQSSHFSSGLLMTFTPLRAAAMNHVKKEPHMVLKLLKTFAFPFWLAITDPDKRQYRRNI